MIEHGVGDVVLAPGRRRDVEVVGAVVRAREREVSAAPRHRQQADQRAGRVAHDEHVRVRAGGGRVEPGEDPLRAHEEPVPRATFPPRVGERLERGPIGDDLDRERRCRRAAAAARGPRGHASGHGPSRDGPLVDRERVRDHPLEPELALDAAARRGAHARGELGVAEQAADALRERVHVADGVEEAVAPVLDQLRVAAHRGCDHGLRAAHVLEDRVREALALRAQHADVELLDVGHGAVGDVVDVDAVGDAERLRAGEQVLVRAGAEEEHVERRVHRPPSLRERLHEVELALDRLEVREEADEARVGRDAEARAQPRLAGAVERREVVAVAHDRHVVAGYVLGLDRQPPDGLAVRDEAGREARRCAASRRGASACTRNPCRAARRAPARRAASRRAAPRIPASHM